MKEFAFGSLRFHRGSIPEELKDWAIWPIVDDASLTRHESELYKRREAAVRYFVDSPSMTIAEITRETGVSASSLYRLFERCCATHRDGRIFGFRALIPYSRLVPYHRTKPVEKSQGAGSGGASGAFAKLLNEYPELENTLIKEFRKRNRRIVSAEEVRKSTRKIHRTFLASCRDLGIRNDQYPFNQDHLGVRALATYLTQLANQSFPMASRNKGALSCNQAAVSADNHAAPASTRPYEVVEFDGHKIDLRLTLKVIDPFGLETRLELGRIWILVVLEILTGSVLGYALAYGKEYTKDDVAAALQACLTPHRRREFRVPGLSIRPGGGFPSEVIPETAFACWDWFRFDNARANLSPDTLYRLCNVVGCLTDAGPPRDPNQRPFVEQFFRVISEHFAHRVVGTTGSKPDDIVRQLGDPRKNTELLMDLEELEDVIEVVLANYNGEPGASGRTPLEAMAHHVSKQNGFIRTIPRDQRGKIRLIQQSRVVTIRGSLKDGVRPHINFENVRYKSDVLGNNPGLIGKQLRIFFNPFDIRNLYAFFMDGSELGVLIASRPWCYSPHSLRVRQDIFRKKAAGKLRIGDEDDPVEVWVKHKRREARSSKAARYQLAKHRQSTMGELDLAKQPSVAKPGDNDQLSEASSPEIDKEIADKSSTRETEVGESKPKPKLLNIKRTIVF